jgi:hypothetical protein
MRFGGPKGHGDAPRRMRFGLVKNTGDKIVGDTGGDVKIRAERKLGRSAEALAPQRLDGVLMRFGGPKGIVTPPEDAIRVG